MKTSEVINFGSKLLRTGNISTYRLDSEIILSHVLKVNRERLLINENVVSRFDINRFNKLILRRLKNEPIAYIVNKKEFRSEDFFVSKSF